MRHRFAGLFLALWIGTPAAAACTAGVPALVGHYYLEGMMEVGSELLLYPDGRFEFALAYGANDQYGRGCWVVEGERLTLVPEGRRRVTTQNTPEDRRFRGMILIVAKDGLRWPLPGGQGVFRKPE